MEFPWDFHFKDEMKAKTANIMIFFIILTVFTHLNAQNYPENNFKKLTNERSVHYFERYKLNKFGATMFYVFGSIAFSAGAGLFIHDKAGGSNSLSAQYTLMLGGLSLIGGATVLNLRSERFLETSSAYGNLLKTKNCSGQSSLKECFFHSGEERKVNKKLVKRYRNHGIAMLSLSIPMIVVAIYGFIDTRKYIENKYANEDSGDTVSKSIELEKGMAYLFQGLTFAPAVFTITGGIIMLVRASKYKDITTNQSEITLNNISPMINPITKTYGISMGFSF
jgi:hypothetical protein